MATIIDVAKEANVSVATVSRVLNQKDVVKESTAKRVDAAIRKLSYSPNLAARNLRRNESRVIMMLAPNFTNPYYSLVLSGICDVARELGYITLIYNTYDALTMDEAVLTELIESNHVDGTIILACNFDDYWIETFNGKYPIVMCSEYVEGTQMPYTCVDNFAAAYEATSYLTGLGHRKIAFVGSENKYQSTKLRRDGAMQALKDAGIEQPKKYAGAGSSDYSFASGKECGMRLFNLDEPPSAVFCVSDVLALGVMASALDRGMSVPGDVSIIGFDDVDYTTMFRPTLTTVHVPCYELGKKAMSMLAAHISGAKNAARKGIIPHEFRERESCRVYEQ